jgi:hypothetical protein
MLLTSHYARTDLLVIHSKRIDLILLEQSERFDRLDTANKEIASALVNHNISNEHGLQAQISALSILLDRAELVLTCQQDSNKRIIVDVFQQLSLATNGEANNALLSHARSTDQKIRTKIVEELLNSLRFPSITDRIESVDESHRKTFDWIFRRIENTTQYAEGRRWGNFSAWLRSGKGIYWINGKAGSGKSTLMKYIANHYKTSSLLKQWAGSSKLCTGAFFFWNSGSKLQRSQAGLFRSLLYEILAQHQELIPRVLPTQWGSRYSAKCQHRYYPVSCSSICFQLSRSPD